MAVLVALGKLKSPDNDVHVFTDSKYVADAINQKWIYGWIKRGWKNVKIRIFGKNFTSCISFMNPNSIGSKATQDIRRMRSVTNWLLQPQNQGNWKLMLILRIQLKVDCFKSFTLHYKSSVSKLCLDER